ncbi:hypothetical protein MKW94_010764 [Papaver nudicaule]|uniref:Methyltransferase type 11 domain-containing protein n=1 Tax=Papaver nudicaule TaxID=74823 RepID=A0AA41W2R9_PAPNU|nr:hypothetical protein [Papaver nudicaule]
MASASLHTVHSINSLKYIGFPAYPCSSTSTSRLVLPRKSLSKLRATSAVQTDLSIRKENASEKDTFSCPICFEPLTRKGPPGLNLPAIYRSAFKCQKCNKSYSSKNIYLDLTITYGTKEYTESYPTRTELFRNPLVSFLYERGWRQNFSQSGFPGPDEEFKMAQKYFKPAEGGLLVDVSCGSGLFSRKFAKSGTYSGVVALDFSETMLRQCYDLLTKDETIVNPNLALVRADVSRLPFSSGSIDAVHAGAALHCWPSPSNAIRIECFYVPFGHLSSGELITEDFFLKKCEWCQAVRSSLELIHFFLVLGQKFSSFVKFIVGLS